MKRFFSTVALAIFLCTLLLPGAQASPLTDLQGHWSVGDVKQLIDRGAVGGYPDGTFHPDATITRAEFAKILRQSLQLTAVSGNDFADTANHWAISDIHTLVSNQIIVPDEYGSQYRPDRAISRREIAIMLIRAIGLNDAAIDLSGQATAFTDDKNIKSYDKGYLTLSKELGLVGGYEDGSFRPNNNATRAEACVMIVRLLTLKDTSMEHNPPSGTIPEEQPKPSIDNNIQLNAGVQYQLTLQNIEKSSYNNLGEQYSIATLQLNVQNNSSQNVTVSDDTLKTIVTYQSGAQVTARQQPFQQTITAGQSKTVTTTIEILLPNNEVANLVFGNQITKIEIQLHEENQIQTFNDINAVVLQAVQ